MLQAGLRQCLAVELVTVVLPAQRPAQAETAPQCIVLVVQAHARYVGLRAITEVVINVGEGIDVRMVHAAIVTLPRTLMVDRRTRASDEAVAVLVLHARRVGVGEAVE